MQRLLHDFSLRLVRCSSVWIFLFCVLILAPQVARGEETLEFGRFGKLTLYQNTPTPKHLVLFVSGDGGWNLGVIDMAKSLAGLDALVVGIDINHLLQQLRKSAEKCSYPAADFEALSKFIQKKREFPTYLPPVLVGYSSGATLVYGVLAQAPPNTFQGAISMGFCPDLPLNKPFCNGAALTSKADPANHGYDFLPTQKLKNPWVAFQGEIDQVCNAGDVQAYVKQVRGAQVILLPKVGHGFSVQRNWMPHFREAFSQFTKISPPVSGTPKNPGDVSDLPLVDIPPQGPSQDLFAIILSGDGGWASLDRDIGNALAAQGISVEGFNTLQYFWKAKTPDQAGKDLERVIRHFQTTLHKKRVLLIGYSLGADVLPLMACRLPAELQQDIAALVLLGPSTTASFEFHLSDWVGGNSTPGLPVVAELPKLHDVPIHCFYGQDEKDSLCREAIPTGVLLKPQVFPGGHHFGGNYEELAKQIIEETKVK